jgi:hypothetical protein
MVVKSFKLVPISAFLGGLFGASLFIAGAGVLHARAQEATPASSLDHVTTLGPACPAGSCAKTSLNEQVRYLLGHWPRDFKIAVVQATENPKCHNSGGRTSCTLRVKLAELILGTQEPDTGLPHTGWNDPFEISYSFSESDSTAQHPPFEVKSGERLAAFLTPAIRQPNKPFAYVATRLDHASDSVIQSVGSAVADTLMSAAHPDAKP